MTDAMTAQSDCAREGRAAFRQHGVTGAHKNRYQPGTVQHVGFLNGVTDAHNDARENARLEALAYHQLSVRDASKDRAWAEKLATQIQ